MSLISSFFLLKKIEHNLKTIHNSFVHNFWNAFSVSVSNGGFKEESWGGERPQPQALRFWKSDGTPQPKNKDKNWKDFLISSRRKKEEGKESTHLS